MKFVNFLRKAINDKIFLHSHTSYSSVCPVS